MELSFISIIIVALVFWFIWGQLSKSKTVNVVADSVQDIIETSAGWAHASLVNASANANIDNAITLAEKVEEAKTADITKAKHTKNIEDWGL